MGKSEHDSKSPKKSANDSGEDATLRAAHQRDESAQNKDIERMSDKGPDEAEAKLGVAERDAHRMRTKNEV